MYFPIPIKEFLGNYRTMHDIYDDNYSVSVICEDGRVYKEKIEEREMCRRFIIIFKLNYESARLKLIEQIRKDMAGEKGN